MSARAAPDGSAHAVPERWRACLAAVADGLAAHGVHPARAVVLLPYAQLMPIAARHWARLHPDGFMPHFETTRNWATRVGCFVPGAADLHDDLGANLLVAADLLHRVGRGAERDLLAPRLVQEATELARAAAACPPAERAAWAERARAAVALPARGDLALEGLLHATAVAWAGGSEYASDALFAPPGAQAVDWLFVVPGLERDALADALLALHRDHATVCPLADAAPAAQVALHACDAAADQAERAAALVLAHQAAGRTPVALVAVDRELTRRVSALLATRGVRVGAGVRDETGWKLSTTHAAASAVAALRAAVPGASTDEVLDWIKHSPGLATRGQRALERDLRRRSVRLWRAVPPDAAGLVTAINALRAPMAAARPLPGWLLAARALLEGCGLWDELVVDAAGAELIRVLGLDAPGLERWQEAPYARRTLDIDAFLRWTEAALEGATFQPPKAELESADVVVLPMSQLFGRAFAAVVVPGADAEHLPALPEASGTWSERQRRDLGLPAREERQQAQQAAWRQVLGGACVDILWSRQNAAGEPLQPSPLVELLRLQRLGLCREGADPRRVRSVAARPTPRPTPSGAGLPVGPLSATSYERLRACPYRFFALTQLRLSEQGELDVDLQKRDWGTWVHAVLRDFHRALQGNPDADRAALLDAAAEGATRALGMAEQPGEFLPFAAAWPRLRARYLAWLREHEAAGNRFEAAEWDVAASVDGVALRGRFDRVDRDASGHVLLIDYKTEGDDKTRRRIQGGTEDTQLPFYALLQGASGARAAYLNLAERDEKGPRWHERTRLAEHAAALRAGMADDLRRIAAGTPLRALGEGSVCDFCEVRGLCRKDFWSGDDAPAVDLEREAPHG